MDDMKPTTETSEAATEDGQLALLRTLAAEAADKLERLRRVQIPQHVGMAAAGRMLRRPSAAYTGISPCFLVGFCCTFVRNTPRARIRLGRVSRGSITSSIWPRSAARKGLKNISRYC